jgi:hypothetical protein
MMEVVGVEEKIIEFAAGEPSRRGECALSGLTAGEHPSM